MTENSKETLLLVEDSQANAMVYSGYLAEKYNIKIACDGGQAITLFAEQNFALVLLDVQLPDMSGLQVLEHIRSKNSDVPVIIMTAHGSVDIALDAMRFGANDFLSKPFDKARLDVTIANILKESQLQKVVSQYEKTCDRHGLKNMIGSSLAMQNVYNIIESSATSKATVFITGESGTGKELCAEAIHQCSERASQSFVALNCAAIPHDLLESEIFGHLKGAFTGASSSRQGAASQADGGTLFLDEIGEMPFALQSKLLRFIQTGCFQPVGSSKEVQVDIRFICATNRDPLVEVRNGRFREDLYYRLNVIPIDMPPLRKRNKDVMEIAKAILEDICQEEGKNFSRFAGAVEKLFLSYNWPGNVRQLGNVIRNVVVLNNADEVTLAMLPAPLNGLDNQQTCEQAQYGENMSQQDIPKPVQRIDSAVSDFDSPDVERSTEQDLMRGNSSYPNENGGGSSVVVNRDEGERQSGENSNQSAIHRMPQQSIEPLWLTEKKVIEHAIGVCGGNIPKAAAFLEISASTIYRKKQTWEEKL